MSHLFQTLKNDWSISATVAGFLAVLISYSGPLIIFFQAAQQAQVSPDMMISWIWGISIGAAVAGIFFFYGVVDGAVFLSGRGVIKHLGGRRGGEQCRGQRQQEQCERQAGCGKYTFHGEPFHGKNYNIFP